MPKQLQKELQKKTYRCLTGITYDSKGKRWESGDLLEDGDLPVKVILDFLANDPPILEVVESEVADG